MRNEELPPSLPRRPAPATPAPPGAAAARSRCTAGTFRSAAWYCPRSATTRRTAGTAGTATCATTPATAS